VCAFGAVIAQAIGDLTIEDMPIAEYQIPKRLACSVCLYHILIMITKNGAMLASKNLELDQNRSWEFSIGDIPVKKSNSKESAIAFARGHSS